MLFKLGMTVDLCMALNLTLILKTFVRLAPLVCALLSLVGNYVGDAAAPTRAALLSPTSARWVISCLRTTPNSDTEYRICRHNVCSLRDHSYACVCTRGLAHRQRVSTTFLTRKNSIRYSCAPDGIRSRTMECEVRHSTN